MSSDFSNRVAQVHRQFIHLSRRERILISVAGLVAILLIGYLWFIEPIYLQTDNARKESRRLSMQVTSIEQQIAVLQKDLEQDPDKSLKDRIALNQRDLEKLDSQLLQQTQDLVPANKMAGMLETMLSKSSKLRLLEMRSIPPVQMLDIEDSDSVQTNLYQHGVQLVLEGQYFDIQQYLESVEAMPWHFYWKKYSYRVTEYPLAEVEIELYTLSTSPAFIGVWNDR